MYTDGKNGWIRILSMWTGTSCPLLSIVMMWVCLFPKDPKNLAGGFLYKKKIFKKSHKWLYQLFQVLKMATKLILWGCFSSESWRNLARVGKTSKSGRIGCHCVCTIMTQTSGHVHIEIFQSNSQSVLTLWNVWQDKLVWNDADAVKQYISQFITHFFYDVQHERSQIIKFVCWNSSCCFFVVFFTSTESIILLLYFLTIVVFKRLESMNLGCSLQQ